MRNFYIIAPAYNEVENIGLFIAEVWGVCQRQLGQLNCCIVIVDDASSDGTFEAAVAAGESMPAGAVHVLRLSRNFGQQAALQAGLEHARARSAEDSLFCMMDSDLQHPPSELPTMTAALLAGAAHVQMVRTDSASAAFSKKLSSRLYYWLMRLMTGLPMAAGSSDFRGMSRQLVDAYCSLGEHGRFNRALFYWVGFRRVDLQYTAQDRMHGKTKYSFSRMFRLGLTGILQFSSAPLIILNFTSFLLAVLFCLAYMVFEIIRHRNGEPFAVGWPTIMALISFWGGVVSFNQLIQSLYIGKLFDEAKARPLYLIEKQYP